MLKIGYQAHSISEFKAKQKELKNDKNRGEIKYIIFS